ncbi:LPS export ABC transporter periplasmic protein LptC [Chitinibacter tainanensis]|uniref:LPS export ABC transporter periplasmic protein LptC n=1 Tax=Chitinibacter tainanensis TaxID=230667 RepID=UPI0009FFA869|nr:LPS export ABC transporter periplasmic protein LptC [Chitinibacter tainanensis]
MRSLTIWALPLVLLLLVGALIWGLSRAAIQTVITVEADPNTPDMIVNLAVLQRFDEQGQIRSTLIAQEVKHLRANDTLLFKQPKLTQTEPGKPNIVVTGVRAKTTNKASQVWFEDATELRRAAFGQQAELVVRSSDVFYDQATSIARASTPVVADMGPHHAEAVGFIADNAQQTLNLLSKVRMTYVPTARAALTGTATR